MKWAINIWVGTVLLAGTHGYLFLLVKEELAFLARRHWPSWKGVPGLLGKKVK
jgi:hypothetical protein